MCVLILLYISQFERIAGGKQFNVNESWFKAMLTEIGQPHPAQVNPKFTCFTSTKVQILTLTRLPGSTTNMYVSA